MYSEQIQVEQEVEEVPVTDKLQRQPVRGQDAAQSKQGNVDGGS